MKRKYILLAVFVIVALAQWFVPWQMIRDREDIMEAGKIVKFRTAPVDPYDPFRGKYVTLNFKDQSFEVYDLDKWFPGEEVYVVLDEGKDGFAEIAGVSKLKPEGQVTYVRANVSYLDKINKRLVIRYPFNRFYMEESKAPLAEKEYRNAQREKEHNAYVLVYIKNGEAVIKDVMVDDVSITELVKRAQVSQDK